MAKPLLHTMARPSPERLKLLAKLLADKGCPTATTISRRSHNGEAPLSFGQQRLWFLQQLDPESSEYNDALTVRITGCEIDTDVFERCLQEIVRRHEVLRTAFVSRAGVPAQSILSRLEVPLRVVDLRDRTPEQQQTELEAMWREDVRGQFALDRPPLLRAGLARLADDVWEFGLTMHHIVSDGVAFTIFFRELGELYSAFVENRPSPLAELPVQFADYAQWERDTVTEEVIREELEFWKRYLGRDLQPLALPRDRRPSGPTAHRGAFHRFRFPDALFASLQDGCRREQWTSNWVLLAAYFALMHRYSGQEVIAIGTPSSTRGHTEIQDLIGFFVQTLILRVDLSGNPSFRDLVQRTRESELEVARHAELPFERIVQAVQPDRSSTAAPIQAWIAPMKHLLEPLRLPGATSTYGIPDTGNARFDVSLILDETPEQITGYWEYDVDLFDAATIAHMHEQYQLLLRQVMQHPDTTLGLLVQMLREAGEPASAARPPGAKKMDLRKIRRRPAR